MKAPWQCPKCGATAHEHGKDLAEPLCGGSRLCEGLLCECDDEGGEEHGQSIQDPCEAAACYHCGWGGTLPLKKKGEDLKGAVEALIKIAKWAIDLGLDEKTTKAAIKKARAAIRGEKR